MARRPLHLEPSDFPPPAELLAEWPARWFVARDWADVRRRIAGDPDADPDAAFDRGCFLELAEELLRRMAPLGIEAVSLGGPVVGFPAAMVGGDGALVVDVRAPYSTLRHLCKHGPAVALRSYPKSWPAAVIECGPPRGEIVTVHLLDVYRVGIGVEEQFE